MTGATRGGKHPDELREPAVRMVLERRDEYPSLWQADEYESLGVVGFGGSTVR